MWAIATGAALGLVVSIPPGPNAALCAGLGSESVRRAAPLILGAALTDAAYSLLATSGVLIAGGAGIDVLALLAPAFAFGSAALVWASVALPTRAVAGIPLLNPATAAIWLSLSAVPAMQVSSFPDILLLPLGVALGTAAWFTLLAVLAAKATRHLGASQTTRARKALAVLLIAAGLASLVSLLA